MSGCGHDGGGPSIDVQRLELGEQILHIRFSEPARLTRVELYDADGERHAVLTAAGRRRLFELPCAVPHRSDLVAELTVDGTSQKHAVDADAVRPVRATVEIPRSSNRVDIIDGEWRVTAPDAERIPIALLVENLRHEPTDFALRLRLPEGVSLHANDGRVHASGKDVELRGSFVSEFDYVQIDAELVFSGSMANLHGGTASIQATLDVNGTTEVEHCTILAKAIDLATLGEAIRVVRVEYPADVYGRRRQEQTADTIVLANPVWVAMRRWLRPGYGAVNFYDPVGYQAITMRHTGRWPVDLVIESAVVDETSNEPLLTFAAHESVAPSSEPVSRRLITLREGETVTARVPMYVRTEVSPGRYERRIRVVPIGAKAAITEIRRPLFVKRGSATVSVIATVACGVSLCGLVAGLVGTRSAARRLGARGLSLVGLFAGMHFAVSYGSRIAADVIAVVTGPFAIFVAGLGNELLPAMLIGAVVVLVPRVGTFALSGAAVFFLNAIFSGQFGIVDVLFVSLSVTLGELMLAVVGLTTGNGFAGKATVWYVARLGIALGVANGATLFGQFCLIQVLHRLFFAAWYIVGVSLVTGLLYGCIGGVCGAVFGFRLRRTSL